MPNLNKVLLIGNLTRDPEVRYTPSGKAVGDLRLAVNRKFTAPDGQTRDATCFVNVVVWGRSAELSGERLTKGMPVLVEGRLQFEEWEKDGQKHNRLRVVSERIQFLTPSRGDARVEDGEEQELRRSQGREVRRDAPAENGIAAEVAPQATVTDRKDEEDLPF